MKKQLLSIALFACSIINFAQSSKSVQYAKLEDNPELVSDKLVTLHAVGQFGKNTETSIGIEANALFKIRNNLSVFGSLNYGLINFSDFTSFDLEAGGLLKFKTKDKIKDVKIVMSWSDHSSTSTSRSGSRTYETTTRSQSMSYLEDKAIYRKEMSLRGGAFINRFAQKGSMALGVENTPLFQTGIFGGIEHSTKAAVITSVDGVKGITSGLTRLYADALITPINKSNRVSNGFGIGGRAGFCIYMLPNKSKNAKPERLDDRQAYNWMFFKSEIGIRPSQGWFFMMGTGIIIFKNR